MVGIDLAVVKLRARISALEEELHGLNTQLAIAEQTASNSETPVDGSLAYETGAQTRGWEEYASSLPLNAEEYKRYGRQMIIPEVGIDGQVYLRDRSVLVVGVGGLGCPAANYLAGAGVGRIGLVDGDMVEISNLHRQILHSSRSIGHLKVESARERLMDINPSIHYIAYEDYLQPDGAVDLFKQYDIILDCTDNPKSRYLISDAAVLARRPLVSASALKTEGQLLVLNHPQADFHNPESSGLCYRCVFPKPPPPESVTSCGEGGILGPVVGVMGVLMATEALKLLLFNSKLTTDNNIEEQKASAAKPVMLLYSALSDQPFRTVRLLGRRKDCASCSPNRTITFESLKSGSLDYTAFCGVRPTGNLIPDNERISAKEYQRVRSAPKTKSHLLVDVREKPHFDLAHLKNSINMPFSEIRNNPTKCLEEIDAVVDGNPDTSGNISYYLICRLGNDSQVAMKQFQEARNRSSLGVRSNRQFVADVKGGLHAWRREVDPAFPDF